MENLHDIKLNINQIADLVGMHRQTVSQRVAGLTPAMGSNTKLKLYKLSDLLRIGLVEKMTADVDSMSPSDQLSFWRARREELEYKKRTGEVCEAADVAKNMASTTKEILLSFENLADNLERRGLEPYWVQIVQQVVDETRDQAAERLQMELEELNVCESE